MMKVATAVVLLSLALSACSTKPTLEDVQKDLAKAEEVQAKAEETRQKRRQEQMEQFIDIVPRWAMETPKPDGSGLYALGSAESDNWSVAYKKAMLDAEFGLAKLYRQELSGSERSFTQERGDKSLNRQFTAVIDKLVARVPVVGFEVVKQEVKAHKGAYQTWVLLKLPYAQFNRVLQEQRAESMEKEVRDAFDDLERRVKARIDERVKEQQTQQAMRLEEMKTRSELARRDASPAEAKTEKIELSRREPIPAPSEPIRIESTVTPVVIPTPSQ